MPWKRVPLNLPLPLLKVLDTLADKYAMDRNNTIRWCISRVAELEGIKKERGK
jgi:hypothetical protein